MSRPIVCSVLVVAVVAIMAIESAAVVNQQSYDADKKKCKPDEYFDPKVRECRHFPGGGRPFYVDHRFTCVNSTNEIRPHPSSDIFYYVCKEDSIVLGVCPPLTKFNLITKACEPEKCVQPHFDNTCNIAYVPICSQQGRFPIIENRSCFYVCDVVNGVLQPKVFQCPENSIFSPLDKKCLNLTDISPTQVLPLNKSRNNAFPSCTKPGIFRTPNNCSMYYTCTAKIDGSFFQTRHECSAGFAFDLKSESCRPTSEVDCRENPADNLSTSSNLNEERKRKDECCGGCLDEESDEDNSNDDCNCDCDDGVFTISIELSDDQSGEFSDEYYEPDSNEQT